MTTPPDREEDLFLQALARPAAERPAFLATACAGDDALRARIEGLIAAHERARSFMESPPEADLASTVARPAPRAEEKTGDTIGRYRLLQKIGEGGCGVVYMAEQQEPVVRRVALKVIKLGMDTKEVIARFEAERQALAMMDHPNIARVLDGGATDTGRPFFVMELVRGVPITKYCDEQNLATGGRLELFTAVCHAVQHAHQKGIIHRDLKPSNILVTLHDGVAVPKVIDFGIAKATQGKLTNSTLFTAFEQFIGTPAYMSPEQAEMSGLDIDTRSDIYSLGVLLYELLTGRPPFDPKTLVERGLDEIRRIIREVDPPRPSTRLSTLTDADRSTIAKQRGIAPAQLSTLLRGDLDWIVMRCLEKDRTRRYETANALALDIRRHLAHEPVAACPPSAAYSLGKFVRRNKLTFAAAASITVTIIAGASVAVWQAIRATTAEHVAQRERDAATGARDKEVAARELAERRRLEADTISNLVLAEAIGSATPKSESEDATLKARLAGHELTLREVLDQAAARIPNAFADNPLLEAGVRARIGESYRRLTLYEKAAPHLQAAWEIRQRLLGDEHPDTLSSLRALTTIWSGQRKFDEAEKALRRIVAQHERLGGPNDPETLETLFQLGAVKLMRLDLPIRPAEREPLIADVNTLARDNFEKAKKRFGPDDPRMLKHFDLLFNALNFAGMVSQEDRLTKIREAEALGAQLLAAQLRILGEAHPDRLETVVQYTKTLTAVGKRAEAERMRVNYLALAERLHGPDHVTMLVGLRSLAINHLRAGRLIEAVETYKRFVAITPRIFGWGSMDTRSFLHELGYILVHCGRAADAEAFAIERMPEARRIGGQDCAGVIGLKFVLGAAALAQGRAAEAEALLVECQTFAHRHNPKSWSPELLLGAAALMQEKFADAEKLLTSGFEESLQHRLEGGGMDLLDFVRWDAHRNILKLYTKLNQPEKVADWKKRAAQIPGRQTYRLPQPGIPNRASPTNLSFDLPASAVANGEIPSSWNQIGNRTDAYRYAIESDPPAGTRRLSLGSASAKLNDWAGWEQLLSAAAFRGRRVRYSVEIKTEEAAAFGCAYMGVAREDGAWIASTQRRSYGTSGWQRHDIVFSVPENGAALISLGLQLNGSGKMSVRGARFEEVGPEVPADNTLEHINSVGLPPATSPIPAAILNKKVPQNLSFGTALSGAAIGGKVAGVPAGWSADSGNVAKYSFELDPTEKHTQPVSLHIRILEAEVNGFATIMQRCSAENYRGRRVRLSVAIKTRDIQNAVRMWLRIDRTNGTSARFESLGERGPKGTMEWQRFAIVMDVPEEGAALALGFMVKGIGQAWFNDAQLEIVDTDVPLTNG